MLIFIHYSFSIRSFQFIRSSINLSLLLLWVICTLAETHRAPFDFRESESELVSGFNTEYSGVYFAFIFLSEYGVLLFSCMLIYFIFFSFVRLSVLFIIFITLLFSFFFIWIRITFCRFRYDLLMIASWKIILPLSLLLYLVFSSFTILEWIFVKLILCLKF